MNAEDTARLIDAEIKWILTDAHDKARDILTGNRDKLEKVTRRLEGEVMEGDERRRLLGLPPAPQGGSGRTDPAAADRPAGHRSIGLTAVGARVTFRLFPT